MLIANTSHSSSPVSALISRKNYISEVASFLVYVTHSTSALLDRLQIINPQELVVHAKDHISDHITAASPIFVNPLHPRIHRRVIGEQCQTIDTVCSFSLTRDEGTYRCGSKPGQCRPFHAYLGSTRVEANEHALSPRLTVFSRLSSPEAIQATVRSTSSSIVSSSVSSFADMG